MTSLIIISRQTEDEFDQEPVLTESLKNFKKEFPKEFSNINWSSKKILNLSKTNSEIPNIDFILI